MDPERFVSILMRFIPHFTVIDGFVRVNWEEILKRYLGRDLKVLERWLLREIKKWLHDHGITMDHGNVWIDCAIQAAMREVAALREHLSDRPHAPEDIPPRVDLYGSN